MLAALVQNYVPDDLLPAGAVTECLAPGVAGTAPERGPLPHTAAVAALSGGVRLFARAVGRPRHVLEVSVVKNDGSVAQRRRQRLDGAICFIGLHGAETVASDGTCFVACRHGVAVVAVVVDGPGGPLGLRLRVWRDVRGVCSAAALSPCGRTAMLVVDGCLMAVDVGAGTLAGIVAVRRPALSQAGDKPAAVGGGADPAAAAPPPAPVDADTANKPAAAQPLAPVAAAGGAAPAPPPTIPVVQVAFAGGVADTLWGVSAHCVFRLRVADVRSADGVITPSTFLRLPPYDCEAYVGVRHASGCHRLLVAATTMRMLVVDTQAPGAALAQWPTQCRAVWGAMRVGPAHQWLALASTTANQLIGFPFRAPNFLPAAAGSQSVRRALMASRRAGASAAAGSTLAQVGTPWVVPGFTNAVIVGATWLPDRHASGMVVSVNLDSDKCLSFEVRVLPHAVALRWEARSAPPTWHDVTDSSVAAVRSPTAAAPAAVQAAVAAAGASVGLPACDAVLQTLPDSAVEAGPVPALEPYCATLHAACQCSTPEAAAVRADARQLVTQSDVPAALNRTWRTTVPFLSRVWSRLPSQRRSAMNLATVMKRAALSAPTSTEHPGATVHDLSAVLHAARTVRASLCSSATRSAGGAVVMDLARSIQGSLSLHTATMRLRESTPSMSYASVLRIATSRPAQFTVHKTPVVAAGTPDCCACAARAVAAAPCDHPACMEAHAVVITLADTQRMGIPDAAMSRRLSIASAEGAGFGAGAGAEADSGGAQDFGSSLFDDLNFLSQTPSANVLADGGLSLQPSEQTVPEDAERLMAGDTTGFCAVPVSNAIIEQLRSSWT